MKEHVRVSLLAGAVAVAANQATMAEDICGSVDAMCDVELGSYTIELPDGTGSDSGIPAMIYFHGAGGSGPRAMKNRAMVEAFIDRGYAVIAPSGLKRPNSRFGPGWSFHPLRRQQRDELTFADQVLNDAAKRFDIDRDRVLMTGFSIGGSLVWYLACQDPGIAYAYAPVGGAFWRPHPVAEDCTGPVRLLHTHGWRDQTVPLEGRPLRSVDILQGDVFHGLQLLREVNGCSGLRADEFETDGEYWHRWWTRCTDGSALRLALHPGGHSVPKGWADQAINWFESLDPQSPLTD